MKRPNILLFLTDDHGQWASSAYGNRELHTPAMQWLADTGVCFRHAFSVNPVCSPARSSFWTGQIPSRHGVHDFLKEPGEGQHPGIGGCDNLALFLKQAGYRTGLVGKWHCGQFMQPMPGFDTWFTSIKGTNARFNEQVYIDGTEEVRFFGHQEGRLTERALRFLRESTGEETAPFFLCVGYTNTHTPHSGETAPLRHHYEKCDFRDIPRESHNPVHGHPKVATYDLDEPKRRRELAEYYAAVETIDQQMVRLIGELESLGQLDNTLIVYTGDHGHLNGHHGLHTKINATIPGNFLEETIHIPLLMRLPGLLPEGRIESAFADHMDLFATFLEVACLDPAPILDAQVSPGHSLLPLLRGESPDWRDQQFFESGPSRVVRDGRYKFILRHPFVSGLEVCDELYDLEEDPRENINRAADPACAEIVARLRDELDRFFSAFEDPSKSGINPTALIPHNGVEPWNVLPGKGDHRQ